MIASKHQQQYYPLRKLALLLLFLLLKTSMSLADICSKCSCGNVVVRISPDVAIHPQTLAVDCHCRSCRRYHVAAFVSYLQVPRRAIQIEGSDSLRTYSHTCDQIGQVERWFCRQCYSKVATRILKHEKELSDDEEEFENGDSNTINDEENILINMGTMDDATIPQACSDEWKARREQWCLSSKTSWTDARPLWTRHTGGPLPRIVTGGCACGSCQYQIKYQVPSELQHCYCQLCRRLSGSSFMTWVPVQNSNMKWQTLAAPSPSAGSAPSKTLSPPPLLRTTDHGQRHVCRQCGSVLTIAYDDQPGITWPASGGFDDSTLPLTSEEMSRYLYRVLHICCAWKQAWYELPNDGLPRLDYAS